jgi:uncharacterized membrane protein
VFSQAFGINDAGQAVGISIVDGQVIATEWSGGKVIELGGLPGSTTSTANSINDAGQAVGQSVVNGVFYATEWNGSKIINLGSLPDFAGSFAGSINDAGRVVGVSEFFSPPPIPVPESSTWAMMLIGFASLALAGCRRAEGPTQLARR